MLTRRLLPTLMGLGLVVLLALVRLGRSGACRRRARHGLRLLPAFASRVPARTVLSASSISTMPRWPGSASGRGRARCWPPSPRVSPSWAPRPIGYDVLFPEPDRLGTENDAAFAQAIGAGSVALGFSVSPSAPRMTLKPKASFARSRRRSGAVATTHHRRRRAAADPLGRGRGPRRAQPQRRGFGRHGAARADAVERRRDAVPGTVDRSAAPRARASRRCVALGDTTGGNTLESIRIGQFTVPTTANGEDRRSTTSRTTRRRSSSAWAVLDDGYAIAARADRRAHRAHRHLGQWPPRSARDAAVAEPSRASSSMPR